VNMISCFSLLYGFSLFILHFVENKFSRFNNFFFAGIGTSRQAIGLNTLIQTLVKDEIRGRVISIYSLSFMGLAPFGSLLWGYLCDRIGISYTFVLCSLWVILANVWFYRKMNKVKKIDFLNKQEPETIFEIL
jgi:MFS family permease